MATADYDFEFTRNQVIERAFRIIGVITPGETLTAFQTVQGKFALNALVKAWQTHTIFLWTLTQGSFATVASTVSYSLGTDPGLIALDRAYRVSSTSDLPIEIVSWKEYNDITQKTSAGDAYIIAIDNHKQTPTAYLYPTPSSIYTVKYVGIRRLEDMDAGSDTPDMPARFQDALCYGLADHLSDEYGLPLNERQHIAQKYKEAFEHAKKSDMERQDYEFVDSAYRVGK